MNIELACYSCSVSKLHCTLAHTVVENTDVRLIQNVLYGVEFEFQMKACLAYDRPMI